MNALLHRPRIALTRRVLFQVHLWIGLLAGLYILVVCVTGATLVFRIELQRASLPHLFSPKAKGIPAEPSMLLRSIANAYPDHRVSGFDAPTTARPTVLVYATRDRELRTILVDPVSAEVLGELPERSFVRILQDLHFDLLAGRTGRIVNGIGALSLLTMCATGLVIWWPGVAGWRRALTVDFRRGWKRINWELHGATGVLTLAFLAMWATTGVYFAFPSQFRGAVSWLSPVTVTRPPLSNVALRDRGPRPEWTALIEEARRRMPTRHLARVVMPFTDTAAFHVLFADSAPTPAGATDLQSVYLDQYSGVLLQPASRSRPTAGDILLAWMAPLHTGSFGGVPLKVVWLAVGLAPPLLFITGFIMWWNRVLSGRWTRGQAGTPTPRRAVSP